MTAQERAPAAAVDRSAGGAALHEPEVSGRGGLFEDALETAPSTSCDAATSAVVEGKEETSPQSWRSEQTGAAEGTTGDNEDTPATTPLVVVTSTRDLEMAPEALSGHASIAYGNEGGSEGGSSGRAAAAGGESAEGAGRGNAVDEAAEPEARSAAPSAAATAIAAREAATTPNEVCRAALPVKLRVARAWSASCRLSPLPLSAHRASSLRRSLRMFLKALGSWGMRLAQAAPTPLLRAGQASRPWCGST